MHCRYAKPNIDGSKMMRNFAEFLDTDSSCPKSDNIGALNIHITVGNIPIAVARISAIWKL